MTRLDFAGVPVDPLPLPDATAHLARCLRDGQRCRVVTVNPEFVIQAREDPAFRDAIRTADLALPDGIGLVWGARITRQVLPGRATGLDVMLALAALQDPAPRFFLLGGAPGVAEEAAGALGARFPGVTIAGTLAGSPRPEDWPAARDAIVASGADTLLVAFGAPAQDRWLADHWADLPVTIGIGVGGVFDYLSGRVRLAPAPVRGIGFEWAWRLASQPWRWRRQLRLPRFAWLMLRQRREGTGAGWETPPADVD